MNGVMMAERNDFVGGIDTRKEELDHLLTDWRDLLRRKEYKVIETDLHYHSNDWEMIDHLLRIPRSKAAFWKETGNGIIVEKYLLDRNGQQFTEVHLIGDAGNLIQSLGNKKEAGVRTVTLNHNGYEGPSFRNDNEIYNEFGAYLKKGRVSKYVTDIFTGIRDKVTAGV